MGQTWSVPAIGNVDPTATCDDGSTAEWRLFTGSGYGNAGTDEGKRFYQLNAITGDICKSSLIPGRHNFADGIPDNALVAGPSAYNPRAQDAPATSTPDPKDTVTRVYFPDLHGRIWRYTPYERQPALRRGRQPAVWKLAGAVEDQRRAQRLRRGRQRLSRPRQRRALQHVRRAGPGARTRRSRLAARS